MGKPHCVFPFIYWPFTNSSYKSGLQKGGLSHLLAIVNNSMACVQELYLVVDLLHSVVIQSLTFCLICRAKVEPRTLYILAVLLHWSTPQPLWNHQIVFITEPMLLLHAEWYLYVAQICRESLWKIILFSHLCGQVVWELQPEPPAWAAQIQ